MSNENVTTPEDTGFEINESSYKTSHAAVRKARRFALQGLYEWLMTDHRFEQNEQYQSQHNQPHDIVAHTRANNAMHTVHLGYYHELMRDIPKQKEALDELIAQYLDREMSKIDMVEHVILLIGAYELKTSLHIPYKVVIDEAMKLNNHFGATDAHKLINAVMDKLSMQLREVEVNADTSPKSKDAIKEDVTRKDTVTADKSVETTTDTDQTDTDSSGSADGEEQTTRVAKPRLGRKGLVANQTAQKPIEENVAIEPAPQKDTSTKVAVNAPDESIESEVANTKAAVNDDIDSQNMTVNEPSDTIQSSDPIQSPDSIQKDD